MGLDRAAQHVVRMYKTKYPTRVALSHVQIWVLTAHERGTSLKQLVGQGLPEHLKAKAVMYMQTACVSLKPRGLQKSAHGL